MAEKWYDNGQLSRSFQAALINANVLDDDSIGDFLTQPQRFDDEFDFWKDAGYPIGEDDEGWDQFVEAITVEDGEEEDEEEDEEEEE